MLSNDAVWLDAPCPALKAWRDEAGLHWQANPAARRASGLRELGDGDWAAAAAALVQAAGARRDGRIEAGGQALGWRAVPLGAATLFWIEPAPDGARYGADDRLALLQGSGRLGFFERDLGDGSGWWDAHAFRLYGLAPAAQAPAWSEVLQRVHPDDRARLDDFQRRHLESEGRREIRYRLGRPDGDPRDIHALVEVRRDGPGRAPRLLGVMIDDTGSAERERAQRLLAAMQARALELAKVSVWRIDLATQRIQLNPAGYAFLGLAPRADGVPLAEMRALAHPDDAPAMLRAADEALAGRAVVDVETRYRHADGGWRHLLTRRVAERDADGRVVALAGISLDVTRQRRLDLELRLQSERLALATRDVGVGIWERDLGTGRVLWEAQMYRLRGLAPDDPRDPRAIDREIVAPADYALRNALVERHLRHGEPYQHEFAVRWPDGSVHWLATVGRAVRDASGRALQMIGLNWDVTQRRLAEAALRDAQAAERASRAKSEFLARVSHELRTPLNAILGFARLLLDDGGDRLDPRQLERVQHIRRAGAHLLGLIDEVLDLSAVEAGAVVVTLQPVAVDAVAAEVLQWVGPLAAQHGVRLYGPCSGARVRADPSRLHQVLANLLSNAVKYNRPGGEVRVQVEPACGDDGAALWRLAVRDTGRGIAPEQLARLFEPFNRLGAESGPVEGHGLGLATTRQLVQRMGGRLDVHSVPGQGSEFAVWLPAAAAEVAPAPPRPPPPAGAGRRLDVLYVEDNPVNVLVVEDLLALRPGVRFASAADGRGGVAAALRDRPDLVLVDIHLPDIDGHEVLRRLRAGGYRGTCIALSANAMPDDVARSRAAGFDDYWTKPIDFDHALAKVDELAAGAAAARMEGRR
jgi:hypothetical protein